MYYYGFPMNKIAFVFFVLFTALSIHAAIQIEVIGIFQGHRDNRQQWIEVKNNSNSTVDIAGFSLQLEKEVCGWPRKLDNLTWCKMPVKLT